MSDPVVVAAAPALIAVLEAVKECANTVLVGDPATIGLRAPGAFAVLVGKVSLQLPTLAVAEVGVVATDVNAKLDGLIAGLKAKAAG